MAGSSPAMTVWGRAGVGCNLRNGPTLSSLRSDIPPHKGERKKYPLVGSIMTFSGSSCAGPDPRICRVKEDGRIKSGHDLVGKGEAGSEAFAGMTMRDASERPPPARKAASGMASAGIV